MPAWEQWPRRLFMRSWVDAARNEGCGIRELGRVR